MKKILCLLALLAGMVGQSFAANVLVVGVTNGFLSETTTGTNAIGDALSADGHTVTKLVLTGATSGQIASALAGTPYDQLFFLDASATALLDSADVAAVASFWNAHKGLVVDGRSYGYIFQPTQAAELTLIKNVASAFTHTGGGLWIGTDDSPTWANNGNAILGAIGVAPVTGNYSLPVNVANPSSVLLQGVDPADLWAAAGTVGAAPLGVQANGIEMFMHFGNDTAGTLTPYISASFPLSGPVASTAVPVDQPWALALLALGLAGAAAMRRGKRG